MGFADALIRMGIAYDSEPALAVADELGAFIEKHAQAASAELAGERGPFANWQGSRWQQLGSPPLRNATTTTIAPTGTLSILAGCSGGIEPLYAVSFVRQVLDGERLVDVHPLFVAAARAGGWYSDELMKRVADRGSVRGMDEVPAEVQRLFATAYDVAPEWHLKMQAAFQRHVHNAVSKTINFPRAATVADVEAAYRQAYALGCKGVTVYRDGSRDEQVLSFGETARARGASTVELAKEVEGVPCPECGAAMPPSHQGACTVCLECGYSRCL
jgi:ribonucleoside-diphosphate reductase alpha chain